MSVLSPAFPTLFSPLRLGPLSLKNRIAVPAHTMLLGEFDGTVGPRYRAYLAERARGGAALISLESAPVHPDSLSFPQQIRLWDAAVVPGLRATANELHDHGARFAVMLWHGGRNVPYLRGRVPISASAIPSLQTGDTPREATPNDIRELVAAYAIAARHCIEAGVNAVEVQTASDYLLGAFLSPDLNRRTDDYGGSPGNRARIVIEILEAIRREVGTATAVGIRTSIAHELPLAPDGYGPNESLAAMQVIASSGLVDYVSLMSGSNGVLDTVIPTMTSGKALLTEQSLRFRDALRVPVIVTGRITTPAEAEAVLARGAADMVGIVRGFIADAHWAAKALRNEAPRIRPCMGCNQSCLGFANRMIPAGCTINPSAGTETSMPARPSPAGAMPRRVAVVGGGPAGMEAARVAASRGHSVILYEATDRLGGQFRLAAAIDWWRRELDIAGVEIRFGQRIADPADLSADRVIWATGAVSGWGLLWRNRPQLARGIAGAESLPHCREVLGRTASVSGRVLVIDEDGGWPTISLAETLARDPAVRSVTVVTSAAVLGAPDLVMTAELAEVSRRLQRAGVTIVSGSFVACVRGAEAMTTDGRTLGPYEGMVLSMGSVATPVPPGVLPAGDCVAPRGIWAAVQEGAGCGMSA
jgi:2,4-dienoyl-CoA reductase-like NADH-dependent reductase (Old Yellow Enzyme family)